MSRKIESEFKHLDPEQWTSLGPAFEAITTRPVESAGDLEELILDWNCLRTFVSDTATRIFVDATLDTQNENFRQRLEQFSTDIDPRIELAENDFVSRVLELSDHFVLPDRYALMLQVFRSDREIFRPENPELGAKDSVLEQKYDKLMGGISATVEGVPMTPPEVIGSMSLDSRDAREARWRALWNARVALSPQVDTIFSEQIALRDRIGRNAGFSNYRDFRFRELRRFYTPEDAKTFHDSVADLIVPISRALYERHRQRLGVDTLRPWDIGAGRFHEVTVRPYAKNLPNLGSAEVVEAVSRQVLGQFDPSLVALFDAMKANGDVDLAGRPGKRAGAYQTEFPYSKRAYLFGNNVGTIDDFFTTLHEFGHGYHYTRYCGEPLHCYRDLPMESAELASTSFEYMGQHHLELFLSPDQARAVRVDRAESIAFILPYIAQVDAFQHWLYEHPNHSVDERHEQWSSLIDRFGPVVDWRGIEEFKGMYWQQQGHLFASPFYYIEYGIAEIGALQVEANYLQDRNKAFADLSSALALGASVPLPEVYRRAGIRFDFSRDAVQPVAELLSKSTLV